jgi:hypothetical protein
MCVPASVLARSNAEVGNYLQTLGNVYAVLLAFVVFAVWQQFNDARTQVEREASEIVDLCRSARGFPEAIRDSLRLRLLAYVAGVLNEEWPEMAARHKDGEVAEVAERLDAVFDALYSFEPCSECHKVLHSQALASFNELANARTARLSSSRLQIPHALRFVLYAGAFAVCASMWLLALENFTIHALISTMLAGAISHILYVIEDLDDCFSGDWQVPKYAFERAHAMLEVQAG